MWYYTAQLTFTETEEEQTEENEVVEAEGKESADEEADEEAGGEAGAEVGEETTLSGSEQRWYSRSNVV